MTIKTTCFGYPKIGPNRELKKALENYWGKKISKEEFLIEVEKISLNRLMTMKDSGLDFIPSNDFSLYDFILDVSIMFGIVPERYEKIEDSLDQYFAIARGTDNIIAAEMTKWFDTNYHYIVPEINTKNFAVIKNKPLESFKFAKQHLKINTIPNFVGPFTLINLSKGYAKDDFKEIYFNLACQYNHILKELELNGVETVQLDEPFLVKDLSTEETDVLLEGYNIVTAGLATLNINVQTYYESISCYEKIVNNLSVNGIGLDFTVNDANIQSLREKGFPADKKLIAGVVSGRDIWKTDFEKTIKLIKELISIVGENNIILSNSAPLFHLPVTLKNEEGHLEKDLLNLMAFAEERLAELNTLKEIINDNKEIPMQDFDTIKEKFKNELVLKEISQIKENEIGRVEKFSYRYNKQLELLNLPLYPTTTIGSFPQTAEVRKTRAEFKKGIISKEKYQDFIKAEISKVIDLQESLNLDVLVHGEFERTDMVEYFAQKMNGFAFTKNAWVQSYGSRCVRPPVIYADVSRLEPMTIDEIVYAQSLTSKPVKGMLTGPVTILNWSFYRKDISKKEVAYQIALALKKEVLDLEKAGIKIIQIDEAAFREGMPLKKTKQKEYLNWAVNAFKLTNEDVKPETQIHTHMCYSEFNEILDSIYAMDSDVISIEASRSKGEIVECFNKFDYDHGIGLGVYDIHSPRVPTVEEIDHIIELSSNVIDKKLIWINPDCGLKTRGYQETLMALKNMVVSAIKARSIF